MAAPGSVILVTRRRWLIDKREIIDLAGQMSLTPHVVEKDYVLGWMLAGIYAHEELAESWIFKGGTCLKKCFFETYRFSEDLDFTLLNEAHLDEAFLKRVFAEVGGWVYEETGIEIPADQQEFDIYRNPRGNLSCQGKISYKGPISPTRPLPRVKLDLTADERIVLPPETIEIFHPYSDAPEEGIEVLAYDYVEAFAEKFRALAERTRPRDLYDVVNLYRNAEARPEQQRFVEVLRNKCAFKGIELPQLADISRIAATLRRVGPICSIISFRPCYQSLRSGTHCRRYLAGSTARLLRQFCRRCHFLAQPKKSSASVSSVYRQDRAARPSSRQFDSQPPIGCWSISITAISRESDQPAQSKPTRYADPGPVMFC
jgi:predicted nucleotidyltransferase component of viral defense system